MTRALTHRWHAYESSPKFGSKHLLAAGSALTEQVLSNLGAFLMYFRVTLIFSSIFYLSIQLFFLVLVK